MASDAFNTGTTNVKNASNTGQSAINSFNPSSFASDTMTGLNGIIGSQDATQNQFKQSFINQIASQPSTTQAYQTGQQIYNVQPLQDTANRLNNAVLQAPIQDLQAAKGFNYDANQVGAKQTQDLEYLTPQANAAENNANTAQGNAVNYANLQNEQNQMNVQPYQEQGQYLMQQFAAQQTGWTQSQAQQLQALQDKMDQGVGLSKEEMAEYSTLAGGEQQYQAALASANASVKSAQIGSNFHVLNPSQGLYSANTGTITPYNG